MNRSDQRYYSANWKFWSGLIISALFLYLAFRKVHIPQTWALIRTSDLLILFLAVIVTFLQFVIRTWRWRVFLDPLKKTGFVNRLFSVLIGFAANCILPARMGEFIRANYIGQREGISGSSAFGTIVIERIFDGFTLLFFLMIGLMGKPFPETSNNVSGNLKVTGLVMFLAYILIILFLSGFKYKTEMFLRMFKKLLFFLSTKVQSRIIHAIKNFSLGLVPIKNSREWAQAVFYSFLIWGLSLFQIQLIETSIGISLPFIATFIILVMASFGVMIPSAPGYIGTFHLAVQYGFIFYGITKEEALSAAILWHAVSFFPTILFGIIAFLIVQIPYNRLSEKV